MKTQHTPGPWAFQQEYRDENRPPMPYQVFSIIGNVDAPEHKQSTIATSVTDPDDARLIASAPELLAALETMLCADNAICENIGLKSDQAMQRIAAIDYAREVISKAKGAK